jgi:hypothetical protein
MRAAEIHCELCTVYIQNIMSEGSVRQWYRMFKDGRKNFHDEERNGWPSTVSDNLVKMLTKKFVKDSALELQNFV